MTGPAELRNLGKSGWAVSPIGLGCWQFAQGKGLFGDTWGLVADEEIREIVRIFLVTEGEVDDAEVFHRIPRLDDGRLADVFTGIC
jgi:aryl-alcohol dehydrogenase-like predicted oxidoreductase